MKGMQPNALVSKTAGIGVYTSPVRIHGERRVLNVGDLHLTNTNVGRHKDYMFNCMTVCDGITETMIERGITDLVLSGDVIGVREKNIRNREAFLYFMTVFKRWNDITGGNVYATIGNHDASESLTDFEMLVTLGYIKTPESVEYDNMMFHFLHYGDIKRDISVAEDKFNIAVVHNTIQVGSTTTWLPPDKMTFELSELKNLYGVSMVLAGHIHRPSVRAVTTSIGDKDITLVYLGNPTRPSAEPNLWEQVIYFIAETTDEGTDAESLLYDLTPSSELFYEELNVEEVLEDERGELFSIEELSDILKELSQYDLTGDMRYKDKLKKRGKVDPEALEVALRYVENAERSLEK